MGGRGPRKHAWAPAPSPSHRDKTRLPPARAQTSILKRSSHHGAGRRGRDDMRRSRSSTLDRRDTCWILGTRCHEEKECGDVAAAEDSKFRDRVGLNLPVNLWAGQRRSGRPRTSCRLSARSSWRTLTRLLLAEQLDVALHVAPQPPHVLISEAELLVGVPRKEGRVLERRLEGGGVRRKLLDELEHVQRAVAGVEQPQRPVELRPVDMLNCHDAEPWVADRRWRLGGGGGGGGAVRHRVLVLLLEVPLQLHYARRRGWQAKWAQVEDAAEVRRWLRHLRPGRGRRCRNRVRTTVRETRGCHICLLLRPQAGPAHDGEGPLLVLEVKRHKDVVLGEEVDVLRPALRRSRSAE
mmetsp:Transcript_38925/g.128887  ORF Transcript_38925/g.128887 Transcript_38925/m.128887 type:complete len:352 (-) Transcript_38925:151-1206(-)